VGNVQQAKAIARGRSEMQPVLTRRLEQLESAVHVRPNKSAGSVNRAIDVGFGREIHDCVGLPSFDHGFDRVPIRDIAAREDVGWVGFDAAQIEETARVCQLVEYDHAPASSRQYHPREVRSDKASAATHDGRSLRMLTLIDEYTRESLAIRVARRLNYHDVIDTLADAMLARGVPEHIRSDNRPEFVAQAPRK
jgi:hypothetical protein